MDVHANDARDRQPEQFFEVPLSRSGRARGKEHLCGLIERPRREDVVNVFDIAW
jgi:hypothetical protein